MSAIRPDVVGTERPIRVATIGLGWVTQNRHIPCIQRNRAYQLVGLVDRDEARASALARKLKVPHHSYLEILDHISWWPEVDAVTIGTSPFSHYQLVRAALLTGKHVLTEKPFTMTVKEGEELARLAEEQKRVLAVIHNFQFSRSCLRLLADMESGKLGQVRTIIAQQWGNPNRRLPVWYEELPLGLYYDESPHLFYLLDKVSGGSLKLVKSVVIRNREGKSTPTSIHAHFLSWMGERTVPVTMNMYFESPLSEWHITVLGEKRLANIDIFRDIYLSLPNDGLHDTYRVFRTSWLSTIQHWTQHWTSGLRHLRGTLFYGNTVVFDRFARAVQSAIPPQGISADDALRVLTLQHELMHRLEVIDR